MLEASTLHLILTALSKLKEILDPLFLVSMSNYRVQQSQMIIHWHSVFSDMMLLKVSEITKLLNSGCCLSVSAAVYSQVVSDTCTLISFVNI